MVADGFIKACEHGFLHVHTVYDSDGYTVRVYDGAWFEPVLKFVRDGIGADPIDAWRVDFSTPDMVTVYPDRVRHKTLCHVLLKCIELQEIVRYDP